MRRPDLFCDIEFGRSMDEFIGAKGIVVTHATGGRENRCETFPANISVSSFVCTIIVSRSTSLPIPTVARTWILADFHKKNPLAAILKSKLLYRFSSDFWPTFPALLVFVTMNFTPTHCHYNTFYIHIYILCCHIKVLLQYFSTESMSLVRTIATPSCSLF